jgi:perosamine synthetase
MKASIPVNEPVLGELDLEYVTDCVRTGWISSAGPFIERFETEWAAYCGRRFGVAVCNGTAALQAAVACLRLEPGDEVILPSSTIISCVLAVLANGCTPVLVDSDPETWCMDPALVEAKLTPRTRAVMPVHIFGHPVDMDPILQLAADRGLAVVEDAAEAHGAEYRSGTDENGRWAKCGSFGDVSIFSFYANKLVTTGEGGMILTDDATLAERLRSYRNLGFRSDRRFYHEEIGYNLRLTNLQAAIGVAQLQRIDDIVARKRWMGVEYTRQLAGIESLQLPVERPWARSVYWMYGVVLAEETGLDAQGLATALRDRGVETRPFFLGMHEQPVFRHQGLFIDDRHPVAERIARQGLYLPSGLALTDEQLSAVCEAVQEVLT